MLKIFDIAGSALSAQQIRLNTIASNLANADSVSGSKEESYKAKIPTFETMFLEKQDLFASFDPTNDSAGLKVGEILTSKAENVAEYRPDHPKANADGYIFKSNVNVVEEMANMISASRSYQTNIEIVDNAKKILQKTLTIGQ
jgi:flagellar basal-body rod protein FlgC